MTTTIGNPVWIGLGVPDIEAAKSFYTDIFGWTYADGGEAPGHYHQIFHDGRLVGGLMQNVDPAANEQVFWEVYFSTDDIAATLDQITEHGGQALVGEMPVAGLGKMAIAAAPSGAQFGLWEAGELTGNDASGAHGSPVWYDTPTTDLAADAALYHAVFGWDIRYQNDDPASGFATVGPYETAKIGLFAGSGMFPEGFRSTWRVFFEVDDMDAAVRAIKTAGGEVTDGPEDTGESMLCDTVRDPQGAVFLIIENI